MLHHPDKLLVIAGPCSLENETICRAVADVLGKQAHRFPELNLVFKGSFDKANRTAASSPRGPGLDEGLRLLSLIRSEYDFPVLTDVHAPEQCARVGEVCDVVQIPAFLCRQTDLLQAAASTGKTVNVKKGQFLSPGEMQYVVDKLLSAGATEIWQTERGTTFGYNNLVVDMRSFALMQAHGYPALFDATHSVQLPGGAGGSSGGRREHVPALARAAIAAGADGLFIETHPNPAQAVSDGPSQVPLNEFPALLESCLAHFRARHI